MAARISNPLFKWQLGLEPANPDRFHASLRQLATPLAVYLLSAALLLLLRDSELGNMLAVAGWTTLGDSCQSVAIAPGYACAAVTAFLACRRRKRDQAIWAGKEELMMAGISSAQIFAATIPLEAYGFAALLPVHLILILLAYRDYSWVVPFAVTATYMLAPLVAGAIASSVNVGLGGGLNLAPRVILSLGIGFFLDPTLWLLFVLAGQPWVFRLVEGTSYAFGAINVATWVARLWLVRILLMKRLGSLAPR